MPDTPLLRSLTDALQSLSDGNAAAVDVLIALPIRSEDGTCLSILHDECRAAFSFPEGRRDALPHLLAIARALARFEADDPLAMYRLPAWQALVALRGPVEAVLHKRCLACRHTYVAMGTSGFHDANALVCSACGDVYFKSYYDDSDTPPCECGAAFPDRTAWGCPRCGSEKAAPAGESSPYAYFAVHRYRRGPGT